MKKYRALTSAAILAAGFIAGSMYLAARNPEPTMPVRMTVTLDVQDGRRMPEVTREDVVVKQGSQALAVTGWVPATGDRAGLDLFILIDDASHSSLGVELKDLRAFINAQGPATSVGVGYTRNGIVQIAQNFTDDHEAAAKALRLPLGTPGAFGSPYMSVVDLMKRWPEHPNRREVILITDGIDRSHRGWSYRGLGPVSPDVDTASDVAQRTGTIVHTIYFPGGGRLHRNYWEVINGQNGIAKLSDETGGESFYLGTQTPVSIGPYLDRIRTILDNQYLLTVEAKPGKKAGLQRVKLTTEVAGVEFGAADNIWLPAAK
jgi:hypothetical protein